jgi:ABC-2 type transport system permease protein
VTSFSAFLRKEFREVFRTWRIWVLPGLMLFAGVTSPIVALITPALLQSIAGSQPGVVIKLPPPTAIDAYQQFMKNLDQLLILALIITSAGAVAAERRSGTAVLVLTKPLTRREFIVAKIVVQQALLVGITVVGALICTGLTMALFGTALEPRFLVAALLWLVQALMLLTVMTWFSAMLPTQGAAGVGLAFLFLSLLAGIWPPVSRYTYVGLFSVGPRILAGAHPQLLWPILTTIALTIVFGTLAVRSFERAEL